MSKKTVLIIINLLVCSVFAEKHLFWQHVLKNGYNISDSTGPNIDISTENIHEDTLSVVTCNHVREGGPFYSFWLLGTRIPYGDTRILILPFALNKMRGTITSAVLRGELMDPPNYVTPSFTRTISRPFRKGKFNIDIKVARVRREVAIDSDWYGKENVAALSFTDLAYVYTDTMIVNAPEARNGDTTKPSPQNRKFFEIPKFTGAVQYILNNSDKTEYAFYILELIVKQRYDTDSASLGMYGYTDIFNFTYSWNKFLETDKTENMWSVDGNTMHFIVEGDLPKNTTGTDKNTFAGLLEFEGLKQNYPNPFNPTTTIEYHVPEGVKGKLMICSVDGKIVKNVDVSGKGAYLWKADGRVASGMYVCRLSWEKKVVTKKMVLVR
jgi:hypothetical protein